MARIASVTVRDLGADCGTACRIHLSLLRGEGAGFNMKTPRKRSAGISGADR